jgi:hypothetical protein
VEIILNTKNNIIIQCFKCKVPYIIPVALSTEICKTMQLLNLPHYTLQTKNLMAAQQTKLFGNRNVSTLSPTFKLGQI